MLALAHASVDLTETSQLWDTLGEVSVWPKSWQCRAEGAPNGRLLRICLSLAGKEGLWHLVSVYGPTMLCPAAKVQFWNEFHRLYLADFTLDFASSVWLGKLSFPDSLALVKQVDSHLGLVLSKQSLGIRCPTSSLESVRRLAFPRDAKFADRNISIRGSSRWIVSGLPVGVSRLEIIKRFGEWKHGSTSGWAVIPVKQWNTFGQSHWLVKADSDPPSHCYRCKDCRVLVQQDVSDQFAPKARSALFLVPQVNHVPSPKLLLLLPLRLLKWFRMFWLLNPAWSNS